ncbi:MAG: TlpA disulfide reductase family protein [Rikenellaceae bacterium]
MKRGIFYIVLAAVLMAVGCQNAEKAFTISGTFEGENGHTTTIRMTEGIVGRDSTINMIPLDDEGRFSFSGVVTTPYMVQLTKSGGKPIQGCLVVVEGGDININVVDDMRMVASGTELNDRYSQIIEEFGQNYEEIRSLSYAEQGVKFNEFVNKKIDENLDNPIGLLLLQEVAIREQGLNSAEVTERLSKFSPQMQSGNDARLIRENLNKTAALDYGSQFIDVTLTDDIDDEISISSLVGDGRWVLIDFWATWCGPCMAEMPNLQAAYEEYAEYGFEICAISLDSDSQAWRKYCNNNLPWVNLLAGHSDVAKLYQVKSIPTNFLISPEGKIVEKNLRGENLAITLAKYIKK